MQWMQSWMVRPRLRVSCAASCCCAGAGSLSTAIRKWWPAAQLSATCPTGPSVLGREKRSVTSAGTPQWGHGMTVSNVLPSPGMAQRFADAGTEPACAVVIRETEADKQHGHRWGGRRPQAWLIPPKRQRWLDPKRRTGRTVPGRVGEALVPGGRVLVVAGGDGGDGGDGGVDVGGGVVEVEA